MRPFDDEDAGVLVDYYLGRFGDDSTEAPGEEESDEADGDGELVGDEPEEYEGMGITVLANDDVDEEDDTEAEEFFAESWADDPRSVDANPVDTLAARDERLESYDGDAPHAEIRDHLRETGLAGDVQEALAEVGTEEHDEPARRGSVLDLKNVIRRVAGDTTVEKLHRRRRERPGDDVAVGVSVDMSGSMRSVELEAKAAIGAFLFGVQQLGGDVVANAWQDDGDILYLTGTQERFEWRHLDAVEPGGADPIAKGIFECGRLLERTRASEKLLIAITDGNPTVVSREPDQYDSALQEAADTVEELRNRGLTVVCFGFGTVTEENLAVMFGDDGYRYVELPELADGLVDFFAEQVGTQHPTAP